jgi:large subunit ribosomal protein L31
MKKSIHPDFRPVLFIDVSTKKKFLTVSTLRSKQKEVIDGVEYDVIYRDVTSDCLRPFLQNRNRHRFLLVRYPAP